MCPEPAPHRIALRFACALAIVAALGIAFGYIFLSAQFGGDFSAESIKRAFAELGAWGVLLSIGLMVAHSFLPFPAEIVAFANGMFFGPYWGILITWTGAMLGAIAAFGLTRLLGRPFAARFLSSTGLARLDEWTDLYGVRTIFIARLIPIIAFNLINYAAGLTRISWWAFIWSTGVGILPFTIVMVVMGDRFIAMGWAAWISLAIGGLLLWFLFHRWLNARIDRN